MDEPLLERVRRGEATPSPELLADVFAYVAGMAGQDCDCDCFGHDNGEQHTSHCVICQWCEAEHLMGRWEAEHQPSGRVDLHFTSLPPLILPDPPPAPQEDGETP